MAEKLAGTIVKAVDNMHKKRSQQPIVLLYAKLYHTNKSSTFHRCEFNRKEHTTVDSALKLTASEGCALKVCRIEGLLGSVECRLRVHATEYYYFKIIALH